MGDLLTNLYPWILALHIIAVITWMAGIFYLPRLYVYHAEQVETGSQTDQLFQTMERKLLKFIMNPSMIAVWLFGLLLVLTPGIVDWGSVWPYTKGASVLGMSWFHGWCGKKRKLFAAGENHHTGSFYRKMNEVPTILMLVIVFSVVVKF